MFICLFYVVINEMDKNCMDVIIKACVQSFIRNVADATLH